jgi:hypothetical protein
MYIAGYAVPSDDVLELARLLGDDLLADRLESAYARQVRVFGLDITEREQVIWALEDPPTKALSELRAVLLNEHVERKRSGLS